MGARDPIGTVESVYERLGLGLTEERTRARAYLDAKPSGKRGPHRYSADDFGLDAERLRKRHAAYVRRYDVPSEI